MGDEIFQKIKRKYQKSNKYMLYVSYEDIGILINLINILNEKIKLKTDIIERQTEIIEKQTEENYRLKDILKYKTIL